MKIAAENPVGVQARSIVVIGAGVVGVCCARQLQRDGHRVRVLDPQPPGSGCSYGNAGVFATDSILPVASPQTLRAIPRMLITRKGPLRLVWRDLPALTPWLLRFLLQARRAPREAALRHLTALCSEASAALDALTADSDAAELVRPTGWATVFEHPATLKAAQPAFATRERHGWRVEWLDGPAAQRRIGPLSSRVIGAAVCPDIRMCSDPDGFVQRLARDLEVAGGEVVSAAATALHPDRAGGVRVDTTDGVLEADHAVVAAGIHSERLARGVGDRLGLAAERGYHAMLPSSAGAPALPVMSGEYQFVTTPMAMGVRLAGTSELARSDRPAHAHQHALLLEQGTALFPELRTAGASYWHGSRSTTPDSLPVIGRSAVSPAISYACGHQHLGLTLAAISARLIADELAGREPPVDLWPLRANRFIGR